jgi:guanidinopropionase
MFRRAIEEGLLDPHRVVQIGIRGGLYAQDTHDWPLRQGIRMIDIEEFCRLGSASVIAEALKIVGSGPTYLSFDVDSLDPAYAPGTGTPEIGGLTTLQALQVLRGLRSVDWVGADVVEVSPPFDPVGNTALVAATIQWEALCLLAEARDRRERAARDLATAHN